MLFAEHRSRGVCVARDILRRGGNLCSARRGFLGCQPNPDLCRWNLGVTRFWRDVDEQGDKYRFALRSIGKNSRFYYMRSVARAADLISHIRALDSLRSDAVAEKPVE